MILLIYSYLLRLFSVKGTEPSKSDAETYIEEGPCPHAVCSLSGQLSVEINNYTMRHFGTNVCVIKSGRKSKRASEDQEIRKNLLEEEVWYAPGFEG